MVTLLLTSLVVFSELFSDFLQFLIPDLLGNYQNSLLSTSKEKGKKNMLTFSFIQCISNISKNFEISYVSTIK
jgi:hypothetical protein